MPVGLGQTGVPLASTRNAWYRSHCLRVALEQHCPTQHPPVISIRPRLVIRSSTSSGLICMSLSADAPRVITVHRQRSPAHVPAFGEHQIRLRRKSHRTAVAQAACGVPSWEVGALLAVCAAAGQVAEKRTSVGRVLSSSLVCMVSAMLLAANGLLPVACPLYDVVWTAVLPMAAALYLLEADFSRLFNSGKSVALAFLVGSLGMVLGSLMAWKLVGSWMGPEGAKLAAALCASYVGGAVNFAAVASALQISTAIIPAAVMADNVVMAVALGTIMAWPAHHAKHPTLSNSLPRQNPQQPQSQTATAAQSASSTHPKTSHVFESDRVGGINDNEISTHTANAVRSVGRKDIQVKERRSRAASLPLPPTDTQVHLDKLSMPWPALAGAGLFSAYNAGVNISCKRSVGDSVAVTASSVIVSVQTMEREPEYELVGANTRAHSVYSSSRPEMSMAFVQPVHASFNPSLGSSRFSGASSSSGSGCWKTNSRHSPNAAPPFYNATSHLKTSYAGHLSAATSTINATASSSALPSGVRPGTSRSAVPVSALAEADNSMSTSSSNNVAGSGISNESVNSHSSGGDLAAGLDPSMDAGQSRSGLGSSTSNYGRTNVLHRSIPSSSSLSQRSGSTSNYGAHGTFSTGPYGSYVHSKVGTCSSAAASNISFESPLTQQSRKNAGINSCDDDDYPSPGGSTRYWSAGSSSSATTTVGPQAVSNDDHNSNTSSTNITIGTPNAPIGNANICHSSGCAQALRANTHSSSSSSSSNHTTIITHQASTSNTNTHSNSSNATTSCSAQAPSANTHSNSSSSRNHTTIVTRKASTGNTNTRSNSSNATSSSSAQEPSAATHSNSSSSMHPGVVTSPELLDNAGHQDNVSNLQVTPETIALSVAAAVLSCAVGHALVPWLGLSPAFTLLAVAGCAAVMAVVVGKHAGSQVFAGSGGLGAAVMSIYFAVVGASAGNLQGLPSCTGLIAFMAIMIAVHSVCMWAVARLVLKLPMQAVLVGANACVGGPATAAGFAAARQWRDLVQPAMLMGSLGYAVGNGAGLMVAGLIRA